MESCLLTVWRGAVTLHLLRTMEAWGRAEMCRAPLRNIQVTQAEAGLS